MNKPKLHSFKAVKPRYSFRALGIATALQMAWIGLPANLTDAVSDQWKLIIVAVILIGGIIGSFVDQNIPEQ